jgi:hypothetical protein
MSDTISSLTAQLLEILYRDPELRLSWKDALSDWILDSYASGQALSGLALLDYLRTAQPQVFWRITDNPRIRDEVLLLLV